MDVDMQQSKPMVDETPLDDRLAKDLNQTRVTSQDAAEFHLREHQRHVRIFEACGAAIERLSLPEKEMSTPNPMIFAGQESREDR